MTDCRKSGVSAFPTSGRATGGIVVSPLREPVADTSTSRNSDRAGKSARLHAAGDLLQSIQNGGREPPLLELVAFTIDVNGEAFFGFGHGECFSPGMRLAERAAGSAARRTQ
jgi:hypothetical protein